MSTPSSSQTYNFYNYAINSDRLEANDWEATLSRELPLVMDLNDNNNKMILKLHENAKDSIVAGTEDYVDNQLNSMAAHYNDAFTNVFPRIAVLETQVQALEQLVQTQAQLLAAYKHQLDQVPANAGQAVFKSGNVSDVPIFSGSSDKMKLEEWLNQISLHCATTGTVTDHQKIVCALKRLRSPASTYMKKYYDDTNAGNDLGSWEDFVKELSTVYGTRDQKEGAREEIAKLWDNKSLAQKDFITYVERYRTLGKLVDYQDEVHIDRIKKCIPDELRKALVMVGLGTQIPTDWKAFLELLLKIYKELHPEKSKSMIFGRTGNGNEEKDPDAMEIDQANKSKGKGKAKEANSSEKGEARKFCHKCWANGHKATARKHNTADHRDDWKSKNQGSSTTGSSGTSGSKAGQGNKSSDQDKKAKFRMRLLELLDSEDSDSDKADSPPAKVEVSTARIEEVHDNLPQQKAEKAPAAENVPRRVQSKPRWHKKILPQEDFPEDL